jgi:hypothetical protein
MYGGWFGGAYMCYCLASSILLRSRAHDCSTFACPLYRYVPRRRHTAHSAVGGLVSVSATLATHATSRNLNETRPSRASNATRQSRHTRLDPMASCPSQGPCGAVAPSRAPTWHVVMIHFARDQNTWCARPAGKASSLSVLPLPPSLSLARSLSPSLTFLAVLRLPRLLQL